MRTPASLALLFFVAFAQAQLINGSFESSGAPSLAGWSSNCACAGPISSADVPGGTGAWSVRLNAQHATCICFAVGTFPLAQPLAWITPGNWVLSGWIKGVAPDTWDGTQAIVFGGTPPLGDVLGSIGQLDSTWSYESVQITIPSGYPVDSLRLVLSPAGLNDFGPYYAYYDGLSLDQATGTEEAASNTPAFRFDAGGHRIWVDLAEAPTALWLLDAVGRRIALSGSSHAGHTLQVDLRAVPSGPVLLTIATQSGQKLVRFVKL